MFAWRYLTEDGADAGASEPHPSREDAERWLGESWEGLLRRGIEVVELLEDGDPVYRMPLRED